ncbi:hypothetical protein K431DRAFT_304250 [Polychaeton citri CBS 116435]|uniref:Uncharacterized protein n=1 Tax=Polychaeton citri CBS 116435 TaxID=1314669 RepID=A0A9P4Q9D1_9PEZI|nr:hypothetical protein K431DRAFT_304250 [Polychaeton citri CBS 116435]
MALITDLEDHPNDSLANETRKLVDLALCMCQESSGMISTDEGDADGRPLHNGGSEAWAFIRRARDHVWEAAGLDSTMLICPQSADDINLDSTMRLEVPGLSSGGTPLDDQWLNASQMNEDWAFLGQFTDLNTSTEGF